MDNYGVEVEGDSDVDCEKCWSETERGYCQHVHEDREKFETGRNVHHFIANTLTTWGCLTFGQPKNTFDTFFNFGHEEWSNMTPINWDMKI